MKNISMSRKDAGAVSIFVVIFAALLITIVTVSFVRIMINDQQQATANDLSQSAYDSAQAGVEDAKRALLRYLSVCETQGPVACDSLAAQLSGPTVACNEAIRVGNIAGEAPGATGEVLVQQNSSSTDDALDQAYTCVKIDLDTEDYIGSLARNESALVPLRGVGTFDRISIEWFSREDLGDATTGTAVNLPSTITAPKPLVQQTNWPTNRPPVFRTQLMQVGSSFTLQDFDYAAGGTSNGNTVFLYPTSVAVGNSTDILGRNPRKTTPGGTTPQAATDSPLPVQCVANLSAGGYACKMTLLLPGPMGGGDRNAYLRVTPFYTATHFRVTLASGATAVDFDSVQPEVDSTGRANELFRRIVSRVDLIDTSFPYPEAALETTGNLCKDFAVTDTTYIAGAACTP